MAFITPFQVLILMWIIMAAAALCEGNICKLLEGFAIPHLLEVTFCTVYVAVFACQGKISLVVIESGGRSKGLRAMAGSAIIAQGFLVTVLVAGDTFLAQAEVGVLSGSDLPVADQVRFVTVPAIDLLMRTGQFISRESMIEVLFLKSDHLEVATVMFAMAGGTFLPPDFATGMVALSGRDPGLQHLVAIQAFLIGDLISQGVTFSAVAQAFQIGM